MVWVNVDKPTKKIVIHEDSCTSVPHTDVIPAKHKNVGAMGIDGGWFPYSNREHALLNIEACRHGDYLRKHCFTCDPERARYEETDEAMAKAMERQFVMDDSVARELAAEFEDKFAKPWSPDPHRYDEDE